MNTNEFCVDLNTRWIVVESLPRPLGGFHLEAAVFFGCELNGFDFRKGKGWVIVFGDCVAYFCMSSVIPLVHGKTLYFHPGLRWFSFSRSKKAGLC